VRGIRACDYTPAAFMQNSLSLKFCTLDGSAKIVTLLADYTERYIHPEQIAIRE